ncbi:MAG: hypothetical protein KJ580_04935, partial [Nanoarchaeota archaeon]|nr:hypothetical protein [Nanoarchaeota archaeon]
TTFLWVKPALQSFVESCMEETANPSVYLLAAQGGVIYPDEDSKILLTDYGMINYAWMNGLNGLSREKMEKDLAEYLETYIDFCLGDFETFTKQGIEVKPDYEKIKAEFKIGENSINIMLNFPMLVRLPDEDILSIESFSAKLNSNLGGMISAVEALNAPDIEPSDLVNLSFQPVIFPYDESTTIYSLTEGNKEIPISLMFAVRNDFPKNEAPKLQHIPDQTFRVGYKWETVLFADDPNNDILIFSSDSNLFPIEEDGKISVAMNTKGKFTVTFTVQDGKGGEDSQKVDIIVLDIEE